MEKTYVVRINSSKMVITSANKKTALMEAIDLYKEITGNDRPMGGYSIVEI